MLNLRNLEDTSLSYNVPRVPALFRLSFPKDSDQRISGGVRGKACGLFIQRLRKLIQPFTVLASQAFVLRIFCYGLAGCLGWLFGFLCLVAVSGFFTFNFWNFAVLVRLGRSCWLGCASPKPALASFACDIFACLRPTSCLIMSLDLLTPTPAAASNT